MKHWFRFENATSDPTVVDIHIIDYIGGWFDDLINRYYDEQMTTTARGFVEQLAQIDARVQTIRLHINSPGGDVFAAVNIANALRDQQQTKGRTVTTIIDGLAASAATIIAMAGSTVEMSDNALFMIHNPWTRAVGNAAEFRKAADELDTITAAIIATYQWHSALSTEAIGALMAAETWLDAGEAQAKGFVTSVTTGLKAAATIDPRASRVLNVPDQFRDRVAALLRPAAEAEDAPPPAAAADVLRLCREAGCLDLAEGLVTAGAALEQVTAATATAKASRAAERARAADIRSACDLAKLPELVDGYVRSGMAAVDVRAHLTVLTAKLDRAEIDAGLGPGTGLDLATSWKQASARATGRGLSK